MDISEGPEAAAAANKINLRAYIYYYFSKYYFSPWQGQALLDHVENFQGFSVELLD